MMTKTYEELPSYKIQEQTQVTTYTIMEYIKSHNLPIEDIQSLSREVSEYNQSMIIKSLKEETKFEIVRKQIGIYFSIPINTVLFNKEFNDFLHKVSI